MIFDISDKQVSLKFLSEYTCINENKINNFICDHTVCDDICTDTTALTAKNFFSEYSVDIKFKPDILNVMAIHYTSCDDDNYGLQNFGLRDLTFSLENDTTLFRFLRKHDIHFEIRNKKMYYGEKEYDITYKGFKFDDPITGIARKIYYDNQVSCFLHIRDISRYLGYVHFRPEILSNLDHLFPQLKLSQEWVHSSKSYEVRYTAPLKSFTAYSFNYKEDDDDIEYIINLDLIDKALAVASGNGCDEVFAYMKPEYVVPKKDILSLRQIR